MTEQTQERKFVLLHVSKQAYTVKTTLKQVHVDENRRITTLAELCIMICSLARDQGQERPR